MKQTLKSYTERFVPNRLLVVDHKGCNLSPRNVQRVIINDSLRVTMVRHNTNTCRMTYSMWLLLCVKKSNALAHSMNIVNILPDVCCEWVLGG